MADQPVNQESSTPGTPVGWRRPLLVVAAAMFALAAVSAIAAAAGYYLLYPSRLGPAQPISFSHRVHVTDKKISCVMCHTGAADTARAGIPPLETCMMCHSRIIIHHPEIVKLRERFERNQPVEWVRVNDLPDYSFFNHQAHVRKGFDCGHCHGPVSEMDRVHRATEFTMGFCIQCHRDNNASHDCLICHR